MYGINDQKCSNVLTSQRVHMYSVCTLNAKHMDGYCNSNTCTVYISHIHIHPYPTSISTSISISISISISCPALHCHSYIHMHVRTRLSQTYSSLQAPPFNSIQFKKQRLRIPKIPKYQNPRAPSTSTTILTLEHMLPTRYAERDTEIHVLIFSSCRSEI